MTKKIDNYALNMFKTCPKKYAYRMEENLVPASVNLPALFGIAIHEGLASLHKGELIEDAVEAFNKSWGEFDGMDTKSLYTGERGVFLLLEYNENYKLTPKPKHVEVGFAVEVDDSEWMLSGRIDLFDTIDGTLYVIDNKTRSKTLGSYCIYPNYQLLGYSYGGMITLGLDHPPPIMANLIKVAKKFNPADFLLRMTYYPTKAQIEAYCEDFIYWCAKLSECRQFQRFPMRGDDYTCAWCDYRPLCEAPQMLEHLVESGTYRREIWEPY